MNIFYTSEVSENIAILNEEEMKHCIKSLRMRVGDPIQLIDGKGGFLSGTIGNIFRDRCEVIIDKVRMAKAKSYKVIVAISLLKNPARFEWFVEKAVETGIDEIVPMICDRTEKQNIKKSRLENIIISSSKQTKKAQFLKLHEAQNFSEVIKNYYADLKFIPHLIDKTEYLGKLITPSLSSIILIGPEGDFSITEVNDAIMRGFVPCSLGDQTLRAETAGLVAGQIVNTINNVSVL